MNKTVATILKIVIGAILVAGILLGVYYGVSYYAEGNKMAEALEIGNDYMAQGDYLSAIAAYEAALDYEPENQDVRNAIAHAYVMLGGLYGSSDEAVDAYQNALLYNIENKNAYWGVANIFEERGEEENMLSALNTGYANTGDENMNIKVENIMIERARIQAEEEARLAEEAELAKIEAKHNEVLKKIYDCFVAGNLDDVKDLLRTDEVKSFSDELVRADASYYYGDKDANGYRQGKGVACYMDGYVYYGDFAGNMRSGQGLWMRAVYSDASAIGSFIFEGTFANDKPNGQGTATSNFYKDKISSTEMIKQVIAGTYTDGLENGKMSLSGTTKAGAGVNYAYTAENGVAKKSSNEDSGIKGQYIIAKSTDGKSNLTSDGSVRGVEGFINN